MKKIKVKNIFKNTFIKFSPRKTFFKFIQGNENLDQKGVRKAIIFVDYVDSLKSWSALWKWV